MGATQQEPGKSESPREPKVRDQCLPLCTLDGARKWQDEQVQLAVLSLKPQ